MRSFIVLFTNIFYLYDHGLHGFSRIKCHTEITEMSSRWAELSSSWSRVSARLHKQLIYTVYRSNNCFGEADLSSLPHPRPLGMKVIYLREISVGHNQELEKERILL